MAAALLAVLALVGYFALAPASHPPAQPFSLAGSLKLTNDAVQDVGSAGRLQLRGRP